MKWFYKYSYFATFAACVTFALPNMAAAQTPVPPSLSTPDKVETRIGTLEFKDGLPSKATLDKVYDNLDYLHALRAFSDTLRASAFTPFARVCMTSA